MPTRKLLVTVVGHVDHGKTTLLDRIRGTNVTRGEAGKITQAIGVSILPFEHIQKLCGKLLQLSKSKINLPGMVLIDTPGHAAFTSLRKRGGSLSDMAILVVDINEGLMPQTIESIEILKSNKIPFIIAANKIDLLENWHYDDKKYLLDNINALDYKIQGVLEKKMYELVAQVSNHGLQAERFDRISDYTKQVAIVPLSGQTGEGVPELLLVLMGLAQKYLEQKLQVEEECAAKGTILEVKEEKGLGKVIDAIIYNGHLQVNDTIILASLDQAIVTKVRALLEPVPLAEMREKKCKFNHVKEVFAATGVRIAAPDLSGALAGMPLRSCANKKEIEALQVEVQKEVEEVIVEEEKEGVIIKADTIGGLDALKKLLADKKIPISSATLGDVNKRDLSKLELLREKNLFRAIILGFNVHIPTEIAEYAQNKNLKIVTHEVIYKIIEDYEEHLQQAQKEIEMRELSLLVRPCKFFLIKGNVFRQNNPAIVGVEIEIGQIKVNNPIMNREGKQISKVKSMEMEQESLTVAEQGKQLALAMEGVTVGRQVKEGDYLYTDIPENDFKKLKELKKHLSKPELEVLKEIAEIKRKENPIWGLG